jgi:hypothetical protein
MKPKQKSVPMARNKGLHFLLNDDEYGLICAYIKRYKITNRSRWIRETVIAHVLKTLEKDYPTLFGENEMRR